MVKTCYDMAKFKFAPNYLDMSKIFYDQYRPIYKSHMNMQIESLVKILLAWSLLFCPDLT